MISSVLIFSLQALIFCFLVNVINKIKVLKISFVRFSERWKIKKRQGSVPTILPLQVRVPSTLSKLASIVIKIVLYLSCEKNEKKQKEAVLKRDKVHSKAIKPAAATADVVLMISKSRISNPLSHPLLQIIFAFFRPHWPPQHRRRLRPSLASAALAASLQFLSFET